LTVTLSQREPPLAGGPILPHDYGEITDTSRVRDSAAADL
jgi:hypothetical protein